MYSPQSLQLNLDTEASERGSFGAEKTKKNPQNSAPVCDAAWARASQLDPQLSAAFSESAESDNDPKVRSAGGKESATNKLQAGQASRNGRAAAQKWSSISSF